MDIITDTKEAIDLLRSSKDTGVYLDHGVYDIISDGNGQDPLGTISKEVFGELKRKGYLNQGQCTNINHRRFYFAFNNEEIKLESLLPIDSVDKILDGKEFFIVPKGRKKIFINIDKNGNAIVTKNKENARKYTKQSIWDIYFCSLLSTTPHWYTHYYNGGWNGARMQVQCKGGKDLRTDKGDSYSIKDIELVTTDYNERYLLYTCIDKYFSRRLGDLSTSMEEIEKREDDVKGKLKLVNSSVGVGNSNSMFSYSSWWKLNATRLTKNSILKGKYNV